MNEVSSFLIVTLSMSGIFCSLYNIHKFIVFGTSDILNIDNVEQIKEGGLGLLMVKNLRYVGWSYTGMSLNNWTDIIVTYVKKVDKDILECKAELIEKGFSQCAKL
ncbi:MAG: hypothetical protein QXN55_01180 [Candidatus Nitrosotenuis sp.]